MKFPAKSLQSYDPILQFLPRNRFRILTKVKGLKGVNKCFVTRLPLPRLLLSSSKLLS